MTVAPKGKTEIEGGRSTGRNESTERRRGTKGRQGTQAEEVKAAVCQIVRAGGAGANSRPTRSRKAQSGLWRTDDFDRVCPKVRYKKMT